MNSRLLALFLFGFFLAGCGGASSVVKKPWKNFENTIAVVDLSGKEYDLVDAGARLQGAIETAIDHTGFILGGSKARYKLKYKVLEFQEGSRLHRFATFGTADTAQAFLSVKAALFKEGTMVGAWEVSSWVKGGLTGGSESDLFEKAADQIIQHLRGDL